MDRFTFDDDYVRRLREGDTAAVEHFYAYFMRLLPIKLRRMSLRPQEVDDIIGETFYRVFKRVNAGEIRDGHGFGAFVNRVADNVVFEYRRGGDWRTDPFDPLKHDRPKRVHVVEDLVNTEIVDVVMAGLDKRDAALLRAKFLMEKDSEELCREFGCEVGYLRVLLFRARDHFRREYEKRFGPRDGDE
jgi:RNA polymerase sigma-70 factor (ECF subfamily)